jgi:hypothetical protein
MYMTLFQLGRAAVLEWSLSRMLVMATTVASMAERVLASQTGMFCVKERGARCKGRLTIARTRDDLAWFCSPEVLELLEQDEIWVRRFPELVDAIIAALHALIEELVSALCKSKKLSAAELEGDGEQTYCLS